MKHNIIANYKNIELRPLSETDIEQLRVWRNNKADTKYLTLIAYITPKMQKEWYLDYVSNKDIYTFSIFEKQKHSKLIGSVSIYNFRNNRVEVGKIQIGDPKARGKGYGRLSLLIAAKIAFEKCGFDTIDAVVHQNNIPSRTNLLRLGFRIVGKKESSLGGYEDIVEISREELKELNNCYEDIVVIENN